MTKRKNIRIRPDKQIIKRLISVAIKARVHSCAPYTGIKVGAALLTQKGKIYSAANIESIVPDSTICAERNALFNAISKGADGFTHIAVVAFKDKLIYPCGTCRQVLLEHAGSLKVIVSDLNGRFKIVKLSKLLPSAYNQS